MMAEFAGAIIAFLAMTVMATVAFSVLGYSGGGFRRNSTYAGVVDIGFWILALVIMIIANLVF